ncbi:hypothetical protein SARC_04190 [Sphaeroforma arctica JP610]|uniref:Exportin-1/Importin-beta-like domain-containing protein n=1 Tax=Sphaeroforma arctica JP610 TaxID=667725 RepID=A0A0L0G436_9EUKA|nr:hypothetical protein SARC_04190 [Sphaeroforma arctica JP610]KNC83566.1 hypothetical protein SARC_04190 [Sphaeroforma arctica JP610]|eukprot:XP_014157468.1 hypothetical protein SARC_04190 [Sphaeroforma arctica JP610]
MLQQSPTLLTSPFEALHTPRLFDSAVEAICGLLQMTYYKINRYPNTINAMIQQVMALGPVYSQALGGGEETAEKAFGLARVFCTLSECYIDLILESVEGASVVQMMVLVASNAESRTCEMTFNFWHDLLDRLLRDRDQGARRSSGPEIDEQYTGPLREHFQQLIQHLTQHITYTDDSEPFDLLDDENDHTHFRKSAAYLIKRVSVLLGPMAVMFQIVDLYQEVLTHALEACGAASNGSAAWRQLEAVLYVSANVLQKVNSREELVIPDLLSVVRSLLDTSQVNGDGISVIPSPIRSSSLLVLANVAHWLRTHSQYTSTVISMACAHMQIMPSVCTAAVGAFVRVSRPCSREVLPSLDQIIGSTMQHFDTFAVTKTLSRDDVNDLYGALGYLLADVKPANHVTQRVALIIQPVLVAIDQSLPTGAQANNASSTSPNVGFLLDRITFVFKELKNLRWQEPSDTVGAGTGLIAGQQRAPANMHPCKQIVQQMWPNLERIYTVYQAHEPTIEKWTRCLKAVILCLGAESSVELVQPLVTCLVAGYTRYMHSPLAYLAVQVVRLYSPMPECYEGLSQILFAYVTPTLALLQPADTSTNAPGHPEDPLNTTKDPFNTHPDVVEDFFRLMMEYLTTMPVFFLTSQVASPVFLCAINALHGYHDDGLSTTSYFLRDLLSKCTSGKRLEERAAILGPIHALVQQHGQVLCNTVINAIGGSVPLRHLDKVAFVLYDLRCVCSSGQSPGPGSTGELVTKEHLSAWLENSLNAIPAHLVSETYKREFMLRVFSSPDERALDEAAYRFAQQFEGENKLIA